MAPEGKDCGGGVLRSTIVFVLPSDKGHFLYTKPLARRLSKKYAIEYWAPASAETYAPTDVASFHVLTDGSSFSPPNQASGAASADRINNSKRSERSERNLFPKNPSFFLFPFSSSKRGASRAEKRDFPLPPQNEREM